MRKPVNACRDPVGGSQPHVALLIETSLGSGRDILCGIARYVREHQSWSLYHEAHGLEESVPRWLKRWKGDGIIARIQTRRMAKALAAVGIPVVDVLGVVGDCGFPLVHVDNGQIGQMAACHLVERGFREFAFVGIAGENWSEERYVAFCRAVAPLQSVVPLYQAPRGNPGSQSWEEAQDRLARWIGSLRKPSGIMVCSDQRGAQVLEACRRAGAEVPDEVAVIGVDNDEPLCEVSLPPLSSIDAGHAAVGYRASALLDELMRGRVPPREPVRVRPVAVAMRLSTDTLAVADFAVAGALRMIRDHAHTGLGVETVAQRVGLSRSVLQRRFRALLKRSVHQEILAARIKRAQDLLVRTDLPLATVAERAGFKHQEYMGAVFKERLGRTPAEVRGG